MLNKLVKIPLLTRAGVALLAFLLAAQGLTASNPSTLADWLNLAPLTAEAAFEFTGRLDGVTSDALIIDGRSVSVDLTSDLDPALAIGQIVEVLATVSQDGRLVALAAEPAEDGRQAGEFELTGSVQAAGETEWAVGGLSISIVEGVEIDPAATEGATVEVEGHLGADGELIVTSISISESEGEGDDIGEEDDLEVEDDLDEADEDEFELEDELEDDDADENEDELEENEDECEVSEAEDDSDDGDEADENEDQSQETCGEDEDNDDEDEEEDEEED